MPTGKMPELSYHAQHYVVRLRLTRAAALESTRPASDLVERATARLEKAKNNGQIVFYEIYEERLSSVWKGLREADDRPEDFAVTFVLAAGAPQIEGMSIDFSSGPKVGLLISNAAPIDTKKTPVEWIRATILKVARENGVFESIFMPHLEAALQRLSVGDALSKFLIESRKDLPSFHSTDKPFSVFANRVRLDVVAYIHELASMQSEPAIDRLCTLVEKAIEKMQSGGSQDLLLLKGEIANIIRASMSGPESVGVGMPLPVLCALQDVSKTLGKKFLSFSVSDDNMTASIADFDMSFYDDPEFVVSKEFIERQLRLSDLKGEIPAEDLKILVDGFARRESLDGKVAGRGRQSVPGADPYLHLVFKDPPKPMRDGDIINIRDSQQRAIVQSGQLVAEIRYAKPEVVGMNVLGKPIQPPPGPAFDVVLGEGIQQRSPGKFYAEYGGAPVHEEGNKISLTKSHVHEGDVNLKSGNIYFDGPVEIKGSVDAGSLVRVKGPLKIYGSIIGGTVISKEPIEVVESIVTGTQGRVICSTHIKAEFIENSNIECDGSVVVTKSLVSSDVVAGDFIQALAPDGVIGGGTIMCRNLVAAANIGFAKGAKTKFIVGVDHRVIRRTKIREKRLENVLAAQERYKSEFRELAQKKESQLTSKHKQLKEALKEKMAKVRPLVEKVTQELEAVRNSMNYNEDALVAATNVFAANCQIEVGGQGVVLEADTMAVGISARKRRDSHLCTYDEIKSEIERKLSGSAPATPAAVAPAPDVSAPVAEAAVPASSEPGPAPAESAVASEPIAPAEPAANESNTAPEVAASTDVQSDPAPADGVQNQATEVEVSPVAEEATPKAS